MNEDLAPTELPEKDFFREPPRKNPLGIMIWICIITVILAIAWGTGSIYWNEVNSQTKVSPFLQVTNRQLSIFLWQFSDLMRAHMPNKSNYLPGFQFLEKVSLEVEKADEYAIAPPELLFLYHTWDRLIRTEYPKRKIPPREFEEFLQYAVEWQPKNWPAAPEGYKDFVDSLQFTTISDLQTVSETVFPLMVRQAFQGWKNYFKEGEQINAMKPTIAEVESFLTQFPHYARNYWRNIVEDTTPKYLLSLNGNKKDIVPSDQLAPFLKVALYNYSSTIVDKVTMLKPRNSKLIPTSNPITHVAVPGQPDTIIPPKINDSTPLTMTQSLAGSTLR